MTKSDAGEQRDGVITAYISNDILGCESKATVSVSLLVSCLLMNVVVGQATKHDNMFVKLCDMSFYFYLITLFKNVDTEIVC